MNRTKRPEAWIAGALAPALLALAPAAFAAEAAKPASDAKPAAAENAPSAEGETAEEGEGSKGSDELSIPFERIVLKNGLEVLLHEDHRTPFVAVSVWYHVGAFHEAPGKTGFAHLFEHLMFQGTPNVGEDKHIAYLEEAGASVRNGMVNGTTNEDRTNYFEVLPSHELGLALWLEADRMGYLMEGMTQAKLDEQRGVVKNERLQGIENAPYGLAEEALWQKMFPPEHPYYGMVIGSLKDLDAATLDDVRGFYDTYYAPSNATLTIAGDITSADAKAMVEKYFGTLPAWDKPVAKTVTAPTLGAPVKVEFKERVGKLPKISVSYFTPAFFKPGDAEFDILGHVLASGKASILYQSLVEREQIAQSVSAYQMSHQNVSVFSIDVTLKDGVDPAAALSLVNAHIEELQDLPPEEDRIANAVNAIETRKLFGLQKLGGFSGKAEQLQTFNHYVGEPDYLKKDLERYRQVTPDSIGEMVAKYLAPRQQALLIAVPTDEPLPEAAPAAEVDSKADAAPAAEAAPQPDVAPKTDAPAKGGAK